MMSVRSSRILMLAFDDGREAGCKEGINQSINQSINQIINQSITRLFKCISLGC